MGQLASELLARELAKRPGTDTGAPLKWHSANLGTPRVDLEDKDAVWAVLDSER